MYNRVIIMGRLTADPELKQTTSGISYCRINVAVDRPAKQGEEKKADFFNVVCWRGTAEFVSRYFSKGKAIHVEGKLQNSNYEDQNGVKHYNTDIVADAVAFCGDKSQNAKAAPSQPSGGVYGNQPGNYAPNSASPYNGAQTPQNGYYQQPAQPMQNQQYQQQPGGNPAAFSGGSLDDFAEILSGDEVPF